MKDRRGPERFYPTELKSPTPRAARYPEPPDPNWWVIHLGLAYKQTFSLYPEDEKAARSAPMMIGQHVSIWRDTSTLGFLKRIRRALLRFRARFAW